MGFLSWLFNAAQTIVPNVVSAVTNTVTTAISVVTNAIEAATASNDSPATNSATGSGTQAGQPQADLGLGPQLQDLEGEFTSVDPIGIDPALRITQNNRLDVEATLVSDEVIELADPSIDQRLRTFLDFVLAKSPDDEIAGSVRVAVQNLFALASGQPLFEDETEVTPQSPRRSEPLPPGVIQALENNPGLWGEFQSTDPMEMEQEFRTKILQRLMKDAEISFMELQPWNNASTEELLSLYANTLLSLREEGPPPIGSSPDDILPIWIYQPMFSRSEEPKPPDSPLPGLWGVADSLTPSTFTLDYNYLAPTLETLQGYHAPIFDLDALIQEFGYVAPGTYTEQGARDLIKQNLVSLDDLEYGALNPATISNYNKIDMLALANLWYNRIEPGDVAGADPINSVTYQRLEGTYQPPDYELLVMVATTALDPVDWIATGIEVFDDLIERDYESAAVNAALAALPFVSGKWDDFIVHNNEALFEINLPGATRPSLQPDSSALPRGRRSVDEILGTTPLNQQYDWFYEDLNAVTLRQDYGLNIIQNPTRAELDAVNYWHPTKNPDFIIEGEVFDQYRPITNNPISVGQSTLRKVGEDQTRRVVVDLSGSTANPAEIIPVLNNPLDYIMNTDWELIDKLRATQIQEVIFMRSGEMIDRWTPAINQ